MIHHEMKESSLQKYNIDVEFSNQGDFQIVYDQKEHLTGSILFVIGCLLAMGTFALMFYNSFLSTPALVVILTFALTACLKGYWRLQNATYFRIYSVNNRVQIVRSIKGKKVKKEFDKGCIYKLDQKNNHFRILIENYSSKGFVIFSHPSNEELRLELLTLVSKMNKIPSQD